MALIVGMLLPLIGGAWLMAGGRYLTERVVSVIGIVLALATAVVVGFAAATEATFDRPWIPSLGIQIRFALDGLSLPLVILTLAIGIVVMVLALESIPSGGYPSLYVGALLVVEAGALAAFATRDALIFFLAFETVLIPMWVVIARFGEGKDRVKSAAGMRFALFTLTGSSLMLLGILVVTTSLGTSDVDAWVELAPEMTPGTQLLAASLMTAGLAVKVPIWPLHAWLPPAHTIAPTGGSVVLAAILLKMGTYGMLRLPVLGLRDGFAQIAPVLGIFATVGIIWAGLICLIEIDFKRLVAYSSVAHMGFVGLGLASNSTTGIQAAVYGNIAHGVITAMLFVIAGILKKRWGNLNLEWLHPALRETWPRLGFALILGLAATMGLPLLAGFWGEFFTIVAAWRRSSADGALWAILAVVAAAGAALAAAYSLRVARRLWVGDAVPEDFRPPEGDVGIVNSTLLGVMALAIVILGVVPGPLLSVTGDALRNTGVMP